MARTGWSTSNYLAYAGAVGGTYPFTLATWVNPSTSITQMALGVFNSGSSNNYHNLQVRSGGAVRAETFGASTNGFADTSSNISFGVWSHICGVFTSATSRASYLNGGSKATDTTNETPTGLNRTAIGVRGSSSLGNPWSDKLAEVSIWNVALTDAEVASLAKGIHPFLVRPGALVGYWPLIGAYSPEINLKSNASVMTMTGTLNQAASHPPIFLPSIYGGRRHTTATAAAGGKGPLISGGGLVQGALIRGGRLVAA